MYSTGSNKDADCMKHYVTKQSYNLLSMSRATRSGKSFTFTESCCQLLDEKQRIVATGSKVRNMYH